MLSLLLLADWERELAKTLTEYAGCVDANVLQYTWPANFDKYRILLVSTVVVALTAVIIATTTIVSTVIALS